MESGRGKWRKRTKGGRIESDEGVEEMVKERKKLIGHILWSLCNAYLNQS